ncbi:ECF transporter S component [Paenibacillus thalictri]|uniref:Thiamine ABC transporter permease n=1 Tax=Paenibacillus thalictri TaxID=2527873 RepID=A0A4Q9DZC2_9BACL|nr:ECF transporter S component [Paenibacillus thalictri]TBL81786.1 thiamine ABC transporter permease [Paenibacillus thalictri]
MSKKLKLVDILVTVVIAVLFAIIYRAWGPVSDLVKLAGLQADQLVYGMWFIASTVAFLLIRKPGVALLAEAAAASGELIMGSQYGVESLTYGILQGLGAELVFALFLYRRATLPVTCLAAVAAAAGSIVMDVAKGYMLELQSWNLTLYVVFRFAGSIFFTGICAYYLVKALEKTGVASLLRPASKEDYSALDR